MHFGEDVGQEFVAAHGEPDPCLAKLEDQDGGDHPDDGAEENEQPRPVQQGTAGFKGESLERIDDRSGVADDGFPGHDAGEHESDSEVEDGADDKGGDDADGDGSLWVTALLTGRGDGVEADVGEEDDGTAGENAAPAVGRERVVVGRMNELEAYQHEGEDGHDLDQHHDVVGLGGFADPANEDHCEQNDDEKGRDVKPEMPAGFIDVVSG